MIQNDRPQHPVQIRRRTFSGQNGSLNAIADWARIHHYWYAEHWPIIPEHPQHSETPVTFAPARAFAAIAIGDRGIVALRRPPGVETLDECRDECDARACQLSSLIGPINGAYRKRQWAIPIRIATIGAGQRHLDDLWASVDTLDFPTLREWTNHWTDSIDRDLAARIWTRLLPRTQWSKSNDSHRQTVLAQALQPHPAPNVPSDIIARAAGLRCVLDTIDGERGVTRTAVLPAQPTPRDQEYALAATEVASTIHLGIAIQPRLVPAPHPGPLLAPTRDRPR